MWNIYPWIMHGHILPFWGYIINFLIIVARDLKTYRVSILIWRSKDNCRNRKNVRIDLLARSTSPHGNRFVKSIPVRGVTVGGNSKEASDITNSTFGGLRRQARYSSSNISKNISSLWKKRKIFESSLYWWFKIVALFSKILFKNTVVTRYNFPF